MGRTARILIGAAYIAALALAFVLGIGVQNPIGPEWANVIATTFGLFIALTAPMAVHFFEREAERQKDFLLSRSRVLAISAPLRKFLYRLNIAHRNINAGRPNRINELDGVPEALPEALVSYIDRLHEFGDLAKPLQNLCIYFDQLRATESHLEFMSDVVGLEAGDPELTKAEVARMLALARCIGEAKTAVKAIDKLFPRPTVKITVNKVTNLPPLAE